MTRTRNILCVTVTIAAMTTAIAYGWYDKGHIKATNLAVAGSMGKLPDFFIEGAGTVSHCSIDPDGFRRPIGPGLLHAAEGPQHYFDLELIDLSQIPPDRYAFIAMCAQKQINPRKVGLLPYQLTEWTQRLAVAFAEHRQWPSNRHIQAKCLVYGGFVAHYAQDLCQPLHTTIHFDGRADANGVSTHTGIHQKVDALLGKVALGDNPKSNSVTPTPLDELLPAIVTEIRKSHAQVDEVYKLESKLPGEREPIKAGSDVEAFARQAVKRSAKLTGWLYLSAWEGSKTIELTRWRTVSRTGVSPVKQPKTQPATNMKKEAK